MVEVERKQWGKYLSKHGNYIWEPCTMMDRVDVYDATTKEKIAYKDLDGYFVSDKLLEK